MLTLVRRVLMIVLMALVVGALLLSANAAPVLAGFTPTPRAPIVSPSVEPQGPPNVPNDISDVVRPVEAGTPAVLPVTGQRIETVVLLLWIAIVIVVGAALQRLTGRDRT